MAALRGAAKEGACAAVPKALARRAAAESARQVLSAGVPVEVAAVVVVVVVVAGAARKAVSVGRRSR
jgi:hypothetical protein